MSQLDTLREHFSIKDSITNMEAQGCYKIRALPSRICQLEKLGWTFHRQWKRDTTGQRYMQYFLIERGV